MMRNIGVGIDVGSTMTRVVVGEFIKGEKNPRIIGVGESPSLGLRHGYIINQESALQSLKKALNMAEKSAEMKIKRAFISVGGVSLKSETSAGSAVVSKANGEVTTLDVNKALQDCEDNLNLNNRKIIQVYPTSFKLDGKEVMGRLEGMHGTKLEAKALFVTYSIQHLEDLLSVVSRAGVETVDVLATPITLGNLILSEKQKIVGVALVDIGGETTSLSIFENGSLISLHTFSIGSSDITNDIALGFKIPLDRAEGLKIGDMDEEFSKKKLDEVIEARLCDIFESIENNLKKIKRSELLPAGIVFVGGGSNVARLAELSKATLRLPATVGSTEIFGNTKTKLRDRSWLAATSLLVSGRDNNEYNDNSLSNLFKDLKNTIKSGIKQLMP
ncbi:MAG: cell division protein FtsA [Patescibacteria group bacterium]